MSDPNWPRFEPVAVQLTKREYFAGLAMQGMLANPEPSVSNADWGTLATSAVEAADALLQALETKG
jgi:hypothetical protein